MAKDDHKSKKESDSFKQPETPKAPVKAPAVKPPAPAPAKRTWAEKPDSY